MGKTTSLYSYSILFLLISFLFILPLKAQQLKWANEARGGFNQGQTICAAPDGNVFVYGNFLDSARLGTIHLDDTGSFYSSGFIASYGKNGNARWAFALDNVTQYIAGVAAGPYGDLYIYGNVGRLYYPASADLQMNDLTETITGGFIAKCDSNGHIRWIKQYPYINKSGFAVDENGSLHINGFFNTPTVQIGSKTLRKDTCIQNQFLATLDSGGNTINAFAIASYNFGTAQFSIVGTDSTGDVFIHGAIQAGDSAFIGGDSFITKVDSTEHNQNLIYKVNAQGKTEWMKTVSPSIYTMNMTADAAGNFYMAGSTSNVLYFGNYVYIDSRYFDTTSFVVRFDQNGNAIWGQTYYSSSKLNQFSATQYISSGISVDNQGHLYAIGTTHDPKLSYFTILEFNSVGQNMWVDTILAIDSPVLSELNSYISSISASSQGSVYVAGAFDTTCTFRGASLPKPVYNGYNSLPYFGNMFAAEIINKDSSHLGIKTTTPQSFGLKVYPNPASQRTTIQIYSDIPSQYSISLSDLEGRQVCNSIYSANAGLNNYALSLQNLSAGMYILNVQNGVSIQRVKVVVSN